MSKKDYIAIAAIVRKQSLLAPFAIELANALAKVFAKDNVLFNRDRFIEACGVKR